MRAGGNRDRLEVRLLDELRRPYVGHPDLDRPEALFAESLAVVEAASAVLCTALAEQKLLLQQAVDRTDLAQMNFYGERVQLLQSVAGEGADGGGGGGDTRAHADAFAMECVAPGLLLRKVCSTT